MSIFSIPKEKEPNIIGQTVNCIICFKEAEIFGGHVHDENNNCIISGFCEEHHRMTNIFERAHYLKGCQGCYGDFKDKMGLNTQRHRS